MVQLILSSTKGNQDGKYFPYLGFLGLTPIRVEGIVRTKLDADLKLLPCTSLTISVRCYEHRIGRVNVTNSKSLVDYTQVLWSKPDDVEYEPIGVLDYPFRITLPANVAGFSTAVFVDYRCTWRVEAVLTHIPITGVGSCQIRHFELPLTRFDLPRRPRTPSEPCAPLDNCTSKPSAPRIRYSFQVPTTPIGPSENVSVPLQLQPVESNVTIKNAILHVERRIHLLDPQSPSIPIAVPSSSQSPSSQSQPGTPPPSSLQSNPLSTSYGWFLTPLRQIPVSSSQHIPPHFPSHPPESAISSHQSEPTQSTEPNPTITPDTTNPSTTSLFPFNSDAPLLSSSHPPLPELPQTSGQTTPTVSTAASPPPPAKVVVNPIVGTESDQFVRDANGVWSQTLTLEWPTSKSHSRWAVGETISSDLVSVKYFIRVKISVSSPGGETDTIELGEKELVVVSTSEQERRNAQATYAKLVESGRVNDSTLRSKSKGPRRLKPELKDEDIPPSPEPYRGDGGIHTHIGSSSSSAGAKTPRRPHTSEGPRDKSSFKSHGEPHMKRRSEVGWGAMGLPRSLGMSKPGVSSRTEYNAATTVSSSTSATSTSKAHEDIVKKRLSSSSGKLSSSSFWAVTAPPLKNTWSSSGSSNRGEAMSANAVIKNTSSTNMTVSSSSVSESHWMGDSSADEEEPHRDHGSSNSKHYGGGDQEPQRPRTSQGVPSKSHSGSNHRNQPRHPPSSFYAVKATAAGGGGDDHAVREWEEMLARVEEKSRKESDLAGLTRTRKRSFVSTMKDLFPSSSSGSSRQEAMSAISVIKSTHTTNTTVTRSSSTVSIMEKKRRKGLHWMKGDSSGDEDRPHTSTEPREKSTFKSHGGPHKMGMEVGRDTMELGISSDDLQSREISENSDSCIDSHKTGPVTLRVAYLAAIDAQEHLEICQADIIRAMDRLETPMVVLAGFNEGLIQEGNGLLLQEIHIVPSKDLALQQQDLDAVGKACSPFPSMIFMPSGETFRPPVFNADGKLLAFEDLVQLFAFQPRFDIALKRGKTLVAHESTEQQTQSTSDNTEDGRGWNDQSRRSPPGSRRASPLWSRITRSNSSDNPQPGEEGSSDDEMDPIPRTTTTGEDENPPTANVQGGKHIPVPQGPPAPGDDGATQRPHNIHFDITAAIYQPSPGSGPLQKLQLTGKFNFQVTPGQTSSVEFTKMQCQAHSNPGASHRYSQNYLKILIDSYSPRWSLDDHKPESTRASDGQVKQTESEKTGWQQAVKAGLSLIPFGAPIKAEGSLSHTGERLTMNEAVRFNSRIIHRQHLGVFWWSFCVDDEHEKECGIVLAKDSLPSAKMSVLPSDCPQTQPLDKLSVEITSFWSLSRKGGRGWLSYTPGDTLPPGFSNLCQVISIDLPPGDGNYVSELQVGAPGKPEQEPNVHCRSAITPTEAVLMFGGGVQSVDGLVNTSKRLVGI